MYAHVAAFLYSWELGIEHGQLWKVCHSWVVFCCLLRKTGQGASSWGCAGGLESCSPDEQNAEGAGRGEEAGFYPGPGLWPTMPEGASRSQSWLLLGDGLDIFLPVRREGEGKAEEAPEALVHWDWGCTTGCLVPTGRPASLTLHHLAAAVQRQRQDRAAYDRGRQARTAEAWGRGRDAEKTLDPSNSHIKHRQQQSEEFWSVEQWRSPPNKLSNSAQLLTSLSQSLPPNPWDRGGKEPWAMKADQ